MQAKDDTKQRLFRAIPGVDEAKRALFAQNELLKSYPAGLVRSVISRYFDLLRAQIRRGEIKDCSELELSKHLAALATEIQAFMAPRLRRVLNATGVVVHTNLGRSVLCPEAQEEVRLAASHYTSLELDLESGARGSRQRVVEELLIELTGCEAAMVVNNNAAAVLLMLDTLCRGREVVVSRGELVEIGGSFRIPEVMARSGAILREVGATNRTHLYDYERAISSETSALMHVHPSNFRMIGFHSSVPLEKLVALAHERGLLFLEDLGSGSLMDFSLLGLPGEPEVQASLALGVDLVTFSGDKVLGGPQAGILAGKKSLIEACLKNQLSRALRIDKLCLAALEATLRLYLDPDQARRRIPTVRLMGLNANYLTRRAEGIACALNSALGAGFASTVPGESRVGGGAFPEYALPTCLVRIDCDGIEPCLALRHALLHGDPPLILRFEHDALFLDPRTLFEEDDGLLTEVVVKAVAKVGKRES